MKKQKIVENELSYSTTCASSHSRVLTLPDTAASTIILASWVNLLPKIWKKNNSFDQKISFFL